jgi:hypothetical protein
MGLARDDRHKILAYHGPTILSRLVTHAKEGTGQGLPYT